MLNYTSSDAPPKGYIWLQVVGRRRIFNTPYHLLASYLDVVEMRGNLD